MQRPIAAYAAAPNPRCGSSLQIDIRDVRHTSITVIRATKEVGVSEPLKQTETEYGEKSEKKAELQLEKTVTGAMTSETVTATETRKARKSLEWQSESRTSAQEYYQTDPQWL